MNDTRKRSPFGLCVWSHLEMHIFFMFISTRASNVLRLNRTLTRGEEVSQKASYVQMVFYTPMHCCYSLSRYPFSSLHSINTIQCTQSTSNQMHASCNQSMNSILLSRCASTRYISNIRKSIFDARQHFDYRMR